MKRMDYCQDVECQALSLEWSACSPILRQRQVRSALPGLPPEPKPLPFSEAGLAVLIRSHRLAFDRLLVAVRPLFAIDEDHEKNSEPPPSAANVPTPPLNDSSPSTDSPNSGEPSA